jgi:hypothetical protein
MDIKYNEKNNTLSVDKYTFYRVTTGTPFQRSMNVLELLLSILNENTDDCIAAANIHKKHYKRIFREMEKEHIKMISEITTDNIDQEALKIFISNHR